jgi:hypothetical protein
MHHGVADLGLCRKTWMAGTGPGHDGRFSTTGNR